VIPLDALLCRNGSIPFVVEKDKYKESNNLDTPFQLDYSWLWLLSTSCDAVVLCFNNSYTGSKVVYSLETLVSSFIPAAAARVAISRINRRLYPHVVIIVLDRIIKL
jgi:hypothetical protein